MSKIRECLYPSEIIPEGTIVFHHVKLLPLNLQGYGSKPKEYLRSGFFLLILCWVRKLFQMFNILFLLFFLTWYLKVYSPYSMSWYFYQMVAQNTLRKYEVNKVFWFVEGICLHRQRGQIRFFSTYFLHACTTCYELPSNISIHVGHWWRRTFYQTDLLSYTTVNVWIREAAKKNLENFVATKLEGRGGKAIVAGPLKKTDFLLRLP